MHLVDFLVALLETQGLALKALLDAFGEEATLVLLEHKEVPPVSFPSVPMLPPAERAAKVIALRKSPMSPYEKIETAVLAVGLPHAMEFHLWSYPTYRALIESSLNLDLPLQAHSIDPKTLAMECAEHGRSWFNALSLPPSQRMDEIWGKFVERIQ